MDAYRAPEEALGGVLELLRDCPAFAGASPDDVAALARQAEVAYAPGGQPADPELSRRCLVVQRGVLGVRDASGRAVDLVGQGEFHAPAPERTVEPWEDSLVALLPDDAAGLAWSSGIARPGAAEPVAATVRAGEADLRAGPVRSAMRAPLLTAEPDETCQAAAERMRAHQVSSLLVFRGEEAGIVTDRDLRNRLVAEGLAAEAPVERIASFPVRTVDADTPVFEALVDMLAGGIHHLPVTEGGRIVGMLSTGDLLRLDGRSPLHVRTSLDRARDVDEIADARGRVVSTVRALLAAGTRGTDISRVVAAVGDRVAGRLLDLAVDELGPAPGPFAWLALGSHARGEQALRSDQDTGICYAEGLDDDWFGRLGAWMTSALERAGLPRCPGRVMADNPDWRHDTSGWARRARGWVDTPTGRNLLALQIGFDLRGVAGDLDASGLLDEPVAHAAASDIFLSYLARASLRLRPPLGFRGRMTVDRSGEHAGTFDIKAGAVMPIVDLARTHALAAGSRSLRTADRLADAVADGQLSDDLGSTLADGHDLALRVRLALHSEAIEDGREPSDRLDPGTLTPLSRSGLRETFKAIGVAQEALADRYHTGILG